MNATQDRFGHPKGLYYLFFAELWERFSFYGMKALLVLYMTKQLLFTDDMSFGVYAAYMSLVYVTPLIGGIVAEQMIGYRKAINLGGILMAFGHFFLTFEHPFFFYFSLGLIIVGNGFFKPNISSFVGALYAPGDKRRDSGFTIFYLGVNLGATIAPLLCAWVAELYGWHYGFILAGIGMLVGLIVFQRGINKNIFEDLGKVPDPEKFKIVRWGMSQQTRVIIAAVVSVPIFALIVKFYHFEHYLLWIVSAFLVVYLGSILYKVSALEKKRLMVAVYFTFLATLFMIIFEQAGSSLTLFADRNVNLIGINAAQTNSINAAFIVLLAVPFALLWPILTKRNRNPSSPLKLGAGLFLLGLGFIVFGMSSRSMDEVGNVPMYYLILGTFIYTIGELFLSPIGLSKMTELSPKKHVAFIMGVWFLSSFYGHFFAGKLAQLTTVSSGEDSVLSSGTFSKVSDLITGLNGVTAAQMGDSFYQLYSYVSVYAVFGTIAIFLGIVAMLISPYIKQLMSGIK
ncbi:MAG: POT family proton-dependent oligopeptide transporter [Crocinitomix sp.]|jgi:POT family proton-dependent oligopeptide transporter